MKIYIILFLNLLLFWLLNKVEFTLFIQKLNYIALFNVTLIYALAIYDKKVLNKSLYIHPASLFIICGLMLYNYLVFNEVLLYTSIFLFILFFILDVRYNSIDTNTKTQEKEKIHKSWEDIVDEKEKKTEFYKEKRKFKEKKKKEKEALGNDFMIDIELEEKLVILGLSLNYTLKQLKNAYKKKAHENHPDKFNGVEQRYQTDVMKEINEAKYFLEHRFKLAN